MTFHQAEYGCASETSELLRATRSTEHSAAQVRLLECRVTADAETSYAEPLFGDAPSYSMFSGLSALFRTAREIAARLRPQSKPPVAVHRHR